MFQIRTFAELTEVAGGPPAGNGGGGVGSELVVSIAILFNNWTRLVRRLDSKIRLRRRPRPRDNETTHYKITRQKAHRANQIVGQAFLPADLRRLASGNACPTRHGGQRAKDRDHGLRGGGQTSNPPPSRS